MDRTRLTDPLALYLVLYDTPLIVIALGNVGMKTRWILLTATIALTVPGFAQQTATSVQQDFEAATALQDKGDDAGALAAWEKIAVRVNKNRRSSAIVSIRKSAALLALDRKDEAVAAARSGLAGLPATDPTLREDRFNAYTVLGGVAESALDYASAAEAYGQADQIAESQLEKLRAERGLIQAATFTDPSRAKETLARANLNINSGKVDKTVQAVFKRLNGQLLLNEGAFAASRKETGQAVTLLGGLTSSTNLDDVAVRSNYAIAALLEGNKDAARQYMAMTGAGRLSKGKFDPGSQMDVPECGGEAGLRPEGVAVIEFSIDDDGVVRRSAPIYAAGGGHVALEFARIARNWSWSPEQATQMPIFFRNGVRVELRCSTSFERPSIGTFLNSELGAWLAAKKVALPPLLTDGDAINAPKLRAQLVAAEAASGKDALTLVPILHQLVSNATVGRDESNALARQELAIVIANGIPPAARLAVELPIWKSDLAESWKHSAYLRILTAALEAPPYAGDPVARSALRLMIVDAVRDKKVRARELLATVEGESALPANDPLRVGALVRLASLEQADGNPQAAQAAFEKSGLSAQQCALVDSAPRMLGSSGEFPAEAMLWGFEGWTALQYDISAEGKVVNSRVVAAYPPFVFSEAGNGFAKSARYAKTYRPDGGLGCGGKSQRVIFKLRS